MLESLVVVIVVVSVLLCPVGVSPSFQLEFVVAADIGCFFALVLYVVL